MTATHTLKGRIGYLWVLKMAIIVGWLLKYNDEADDKQV